jgi:hypothetical protein
MEKLAGRMGNIRKQLKSCPEMGLGIHAQLPNSSLKICSPSGYNTYNFI